MNTYDSLPDLSDHAGIWDPFIPYHHNGEPTDRSLPRGAVALRPRDLPR